MGIVIFEIVLGLAFIVVAAIWYNRGTARYRTATQLWHRGEATIVSASYQRTVQRTGQGTVTSYQPVVNYSFGQIGERSGNRAFLNNRNLGSQSKAEAWVARYPAGARVPVWWDPADPQQSALELNPPGKTAALVFTFLGVFLLVLGIYLLVRMMTGR